MASPLDPLLGSIPVVGPADLLTLVQLVEAHRLQLDALPAQLAVLQAQLTAAGHGSLINLRVVNGGTPTSQMRVTADLLAIEGGLVGALTSRPFDVTVDITTTGLNGRMGTLADVMWFIWAGVNPTTNAVGLTAQTTADRTGLDLSDASFAGFTQWRRVGAVPRAGGSLLARRQLNQTVLYDEQQQLTTTYQTAWTTQSAAAVVPSTAGIAYLQAKIIAIAGNPGVAVMQFRPTGSGVTNGVRTSGSVSPQAGTTTTNDITANARVFLDSSQQFDWKMSLAQVSAQPAIDLSLTGYEDAV